MIGASGQSDQIDRNERTWAMVFVLVLSFLGLLFRVGWLQIVQGDAFLRESEANRLRVDPIPAPRGLLLDREGRPLVQNRPSRNFVIDPATVRGREKELTEFLSRFQDVDGTPLFDSVFLQRLFRQARQTPSQRPVLLEDASPAEIALFSENLYRLPGILQEVTMRREYPFGGLAGHLLGYIGEIPEELLDSLEGKGYRLGDLIGEMGLEEEYETELKGRDGVRWIEVDAKGRIVGTPQGMPRTEPISGLHVRTTIDLDLQRTAEEAFPDSLTGSVVALDPRTGEILAMCSSPRIDPNIFTLPGRRRAREWAKLALDPRRPLNDRAIQGTYEPGSTFKIVTSLAGLISGKATAHQHMPVACHGGFRFGARIQHCWQEKPPYHGSLDMIQALTESCDVYYYQLGLLVDMPWINKVGASLGLGGRTGVDLPDEKNGLLVDSAIHEERNKRLGWKWARGLILNLAIGQGELVTPLQLATMVGGVANGYAVMRPHLMQAILEPNNGKVVRRYSPDTLSALGWSDATRQTIHTAMDSVVNGSHGTGHTARLPGIEVGGKTGSAENPHGRTHALFVCAAPMEAPEIAIGVIVENGGHGGSTAGPIAAAIMRTYFRKTGRLPKDTSAAQGSGAAFRRMDLTPSNDR